MILFAEHFKQTFYIRIFRICLFCQYFPVCKSDCPWVPPFKVLAVKVSKYHITTIRVSCCYLLPPTFASAYFSVGAGAVVPLVPYRLTVYQPTIYRGIRTMYPFEAAARINKEQFFRRPRNLKQSPTSTRH